MKPKMFKLADEYVSVHWYSTEEWKRVFLLIFGPESNDEHKKKALEILLVWKSRNPYLPSAIESTLGLVEVDLQCPSDVNDVCTSDRLLRLMYSSVIMRFVNHTLDEAQSKRFTLLKAAAHLEIPQWIVNLRHEAAHGHELPSLNAMRSATHKALEWLLNAYWEPQNQKLMNFSTASYLDNLEESVSKLLNIHNLLAMCLYPSFKLDTISKIPDEELRNNLIDDLKYTMDQQFNKEMPIKHILTRIIDILVSQLNNLKNVKIHGDMFAKIMVEPDSLFLSDIVNKKIKSNVILPASWFILWQPLLNVMHTFDILPALINRLINLLVNDKETKSRKEKAAYWLKEIFGGLNKCNSVKTLDMSTNYKENVFRKNAQEALYSVLIKKHPNLEYGLVFNLLKPVPHDISNINFIENVLKQYNPYSIIYAKELISLSQPKINIENELQMMMLLRIINNEFSYRNLTTETIHTLDDFKNTCSDVAMVEPSDLCVLSDNLNSWRKHTGNCSWETCPIGTLPWQVGIDNPLF